MTNRYLTKAAWSVWVLLALAFIGCGEGSAPTAADEETNIAAPQAFGRLIDTAPVENVTYTCAGQTRQTNAQGEFACSSFPVWFSIGNIEIAKVTKLPNSDAAVFTQNLLSHSTVAKRHPEVIRLSSFLNSIDNDANASNGLTLDPQSIDLINNLVVKKTAFNLLGDETLGSIVAQVQAQNARRDPTYHFVPLSVDDITMGLSIAAGKQYNTTDKE